MNDEIKEILDKPKILMLSYGNYISLDDYVKLKDYITNLQQDNTMYAQLKDEYEEEIKDLQKENEILKMDIEAMKHNYNLLVTLIGNGESITQKFENGLKGDSNE